VIDHRLLICAGGAIVFHLALAKGLDQLPHYQLPRPPQTVAIRVIEPPPKQPPPEPEKPPEPPKPEEPKIVPHEAPRPHPTHAITTASVAKDAPPTDKPVVTTDTTDEPVFGVTMESTSTQGTGPAVPVGNTMQPAAQGSDKPVKPLAPPIAAFEATKMPLPQGRCFGKYTEEAKAAGTEGTVVLDIIVGEDGRVRDISVTQGLPNGLTQAAIAALKQCRFTPGEKDGKPVPVKIRGFKIQFVLSEAQ
jgi:protein TonB